MTTAPITVPDTYAPPELSPEFQAFLKLHDQHHSTELELAFKQFTAEIHSDIHAELVKRAAAEDWRAGRRNRNRGLTMLIAIMGAFLIPTLLVTCGLIVLLPFATAFTIFPDCLVTIYAWWKKY